MRLPIAVLLLAPSVSAQWLNYHSASTPRTADGRPNLTAPTPRTKEGKPDLSGVWQVAAEPRGPGLFGLGESPNHNPLVCNRFGGGYAR